MATVAPNARQGEENSNHRAGVIKTALKYAGGSAVGITGILTAAAFGAVPTPLAMVAVLVFGVIMVGGLLVAARG